ncbi:myrosinase 1-like [Zerene cesonia]|uniref:myrosinase 1-like n=1 Tax=Zerene cesonia TaxID=33412 RepID=UPI0018E51AF3|nr:myrosinase 1-like [Zerene cesonia]
MGSEDKCRSFQDIVDSFHQCSSDHEKALSSIPELEDKDKRIVIQRQASMFLRFLVTCASEKDRFPDNFIFGVSTSAYQIEGGRDEDGNGRNVWDAITRVPGAIADNSTGDIACDSYHKWKRDIQLLKELRVSTYRFSISWSRVLPNGTTDNINEEGLAFYDNFLNELLEAGIEPLVTLYHFDLPSALQYQGGWTNSSIVDWYGDYAELIFSRFADRVQNWLTINEPEIVCDQLAVLPLIIDDKNAASLVCTKNLLLAHANAHRIYRAKYKQLYNEPEEDDEKNKIVDIMMQSFNDRFIHPVFAKNGGWPKGLQKYIAKYSKDLGYNTSLLPSFTEREKKFIRGTYDYAGFNYYFAVKATDINSSIPWNPLISIFSQEGYTVETYASPEGLRKLMNWLKDRYGIQDLLITENGYADEDTTHLDYGRVKYIKQHLEQILLSIYEDGLNVFGYMVWSLMDNFEWTSGYKVRYGLYNIDFDDSERPATPRISASYYTCVNLNRTMQECNDIYFQ